MDAVAHGRTSDVHQLLLQLMKYDLSYELWAIDIHTFNRTKKLFYELKTYDARDILLRQMSRIQERWPQLIEVSEIPLNLT